MNRKILLTLALTTVAVVVATVFAIRKPSVVSGRAATAAELVSPRALAAIQRMQNAKGIQRELLTVIESEPNPARRSRAVERAAAMVEPEDFAVTLGALVQSTDPAAAELRDELVRRWAESNPAAVASWAAQLPEVSATQAVLKQIAVAWADKDLGGATNWLASMPEGATKQSATLDIAYEAAAAAPVASLSLAVTLPATEERDDLMVHAVSQWGISDSATAINWAKRIANPDLRDKILAAAAVSLAGKDAAAAAALIGTAVRPGIVQDRAAVLIVQLWAQTSPQAAANWVNLFPESPVRAAALQSLDTIRNQQLASAAGSY
jgi:hypothetical protein